jgi:ABC-type Zn2+ transport system substrate-binding protein/surface adhesin
MNVAFEGNNLYIELSSPAANIVGFEHHPRTQEQKAAVKKAIETLEAGEKLFALPDSTCGKLVKTNVQTDVENDSDHEPGQPHAQDHAESGKEAEVEKHQHGEHHEGDDHERHSEFKAEYHFVCKTPQKLKLIEVNLFRVFPGIEHIEVQLLTDTKQSALELTAQKNKIIF